MKDQVVVELATIEALRGAVTTYVAKVRTSVSEIYREVRRAEQVTRDAVAVHRRQLMQAEWRLANALEALSRCGEDGRAEAESCVRTANVAKVVATNLLDNVQRAERQVGVALQELVRATSDAENSVSDQASGASTVLLELEERITAITNSRQVTESDRHALRDITGWGHLRINQAMSEGSLEELSTIAARANAVSYALAKLPVHEGIVLRGSAGNLTEAQIARYEPGEVCVEDRFVHASVDPDVADGGFRGNVIWAIDSMRGRNVAPRSAFPAEREVMFDKFTRFEVIAKDRLPETGQWLIYMREI